MLLPDFSPVTSRRHFIRCASLAITAAVPGARAESTTPRAVEITA